MKYLVAIIAICQIIQTVQYLTTPAQASPPAIPVIIDGISSRVSSGSHMLPVTVREPIRMSR